MGGDVGIVGDAVGSLVVGDLVVGCLVGGIVGDDVSAHTFSAHSPPMQSEDTSQALPSAQRTQALVPPQSTSLSMISFTPFLHDWKWEHSWAPLSERGRDNLH